MKAWQVLTLGGIALALSKTTGVNADARVVRMAQAIARAEGYGVPGAIPTVRNNPGNIRSTTPPYEIRTYATPDEGWAALYRQVARMLAGSSLYPPDWTIEQVAQRYTGEAQYMNWARNVASFLGVSTKTVFSKAV